jgi:hypothetical protein
MQWSHNVEGTVFWLSSGLTIFFASKITERIYYWEGLHYKLSGGFNFHSDLSSMTTLQEIHIKPFQFPQTHL